jgi:hypothetical protein
MTAACEVCGRSLAGRKPGIRYCSARCRTAAYERRKAAQVQEALLSGSGVTQGAVSDSPSLTLPDGSLTSENGNRVRLPDGYSESGLSVEDAVAWAHEILDRYEGADQAVGTDVPNEALVRDPTPPDPDDPAVPCPDPQRCRFRWRHASGPWTCAYNHPAGTANGAPW